MASLGSALDNAFLLSSLKKRLPSDIQDHYFAGMSDDDLWFRLRDDYNTWQQDSGLPRFDLGTIGSFYGEGGRYPLEALAETQLPDPTYLEPTATPQTPLGGGDPQYQYVEALRSPQLPLGAAPQPTPLPPSGGGGLGLANLQQLFSQQGATQSPHAGMTEMSKALRGGTPSG